MTPNIEQVATACAEELWMLSKPSIGFDGLKEIFTRHLTTHTQSLEDRVKELEFYLQHKDELEYCGDKAKAKIQSLEEENKRLRELIIHGYVHAGYEDSGFRQMTTEQKQLFISVLRQHEFDFTANRLNEALTKPT